MNKQASTLIFVIVVLLFASIVIFSKSTQSTLDDQNKAFGQQLSKLQSRIIILASTMQSMTESYSKDSVPESNKDDKLSNNIQLLNAKLAQQDKRIAILNEEIQSVLTHLKRIDSASLLVTDARQLDVQPDKPLANNDRRLDDANLKARRTEYQTQLYTDFKNEIIDPVWSDTIQNSLMALFDQKNDLAGANLTASQCRTAACEISWTIDNNLDDFGRFELENNILVELARLGLDTAIGVNSSNGANKVIAKSSERLVTHK